MRGIPLSFGKIFHVAFFKLLNQYWEQTISFLTNCDTYPTLENECAFLAVQYFQKIYMGTQKLNGFRIPMISIAIRGHHSKYLCVSFGIALHL